MSDVYAALAIRDALADDTALTHYAIQYVHRDAAAEDHVVQYVEAALHRLLDEAGAPAEPRLLLVVDEDRARALHEKFRNPDTPAFAWPLPRWLLHVGCAYRDGGSVMTDTVMIGSRLPAHDRLHGDRFAPEAAENIIGQSLNVHTDGETVRGTVRTARVVDDGWALDVTIEVPADSAAARAVRAAPDLAVSLGPGAEPDPPLPAATPEEPPNE